MLRTLYIYKRKEREEDREGKKSAKNNKGKTRSEDRYDEPWKQEGKVVNLKHAWLKEKKRGWDEDKTRRVPKEKLREKPGMINQRKRTKSQRKLG